FGCRPFDDKCTETYARTRAALELEGLIIGANDLLIASIAVANDLILVTSNTREFSRIPGLRLENWELP
ncbi:type II toxin-antitoxin system VapC family toxin, partial [Arthrospira platensis SPKY1]|nr:type II toxin-antitoxin system VapC family toxin [Arthrospira platensis SPKY1]